MERCGKQYRMASSGGFAGESPVNLDHRTKSGVVVVALLVVVVVAVEERGGRSCSYARGCKKSNQTDPNMIKLT